MSEECHFTMVPIFVEISIAKISIKAKKLHYHLM